MRCEFPTVGFESETAMMRYSDYVKAGEIGVIRVEEQEASVPDVVVLQIP